MRLVFISSVTAITPLRTISVDDRIGLGLRLNLLMRFWLQLSMRRSRAFPLDADRDHEIAVGVDGQPRRRA